MLGIIGTKFKLTLDKFPAGDWLFFFGRD